MIIITFVIQAGCLNNFRYILYLTRRTKSCKYLFKGWHFIDFIDFPHSVKQTQYSPMLKRNRSLWHFNKSTHLFQTRTHSWAIWVISSPSLLGVFGHIVYSSGHSKSPSCGNISNVNNISVISAKSAESSISLKVSIPKNRSSAIPESGRWDHVGLPHRQCSRQTGLCQEPPWQCLRGFLYYLTNILLIWL